MSKNLLAFNLFVLFSINNYSQTLSPKYSNEFLSIGVGARALGMSNAYVTSVNDVTSGYWNPAGLLGIKDDAQVGLMHSESFAGILKYDYGAFAKPIDSLSALGISIIRLGVDDIPNTIELIDANNNIDYNKISSFSVTDFALMLSYARKLNLGKLDGLHNSIRSSPIQSSLWRFMPTALMTTTGAGSVRTS